MHTNTKKIIHKLLSNRKIVLATLLFIVISLFLILGLNKNSDYQEFFYNKKVVTSRDRTLVKNFLLNNAESIIPESVTPNRKWKVDSVTFDEGSWTGSLKYSDGVKSGVAEFTFMTTKDSHLSVGLKKVR
jgi:hypothetical protein